MFSIGLFICSIISSFGLTIIIVEKGYDWPIDPIKRRLVKLVSYLNPKMATVFDCSVCLSFWASLLIEAALFCISGFTYLMWPISGFAVAGVTWIIYEYLNSHDQLLSSINRTEKQDSKEDQQVN